MARGRKAPPIPAVTYADVGPPPLHDPLEASAWMHQLLTVAADEVRLDPNLSPTARRNELMKLADKMTGLVPQSRIWKAEDVIRNDGAELAQSGIGGPKLSHATPVTTAAGAPTPRRGRPRKQ